jgi:hypothetical protein
MEVRMRELSRIRLIMVVLPIALLAACLAPPDGSTEASPPTVSSATSSVGAASTTALVVQPSESAVDRARPPARTTDPTSRSARDATTRSSGRSPRQSASARTTDHLAPATSTRSSSSTARAQGSSRRSTRTSDDIALPPPRPPVPYEVDALFNFGSGNTIGNLRKERDTKCAAAGAKKSCLTIATEPEGAANSCTIDELLSNPEPNANGKVKIGSTYKLRVNCDDEGSVGSTGTGAASTSATDSADDSEDDDDG